MSPIEKNYVDAISSYELFEFLEHPGSTVVLGGQTAVDLYRGYQNYYQSNLPALKTVNHAVHGGFEQGLTAQGLAPRGWQVSGNNIDPTISFSADTPSGSNTSFGLNGDFVVDGNDLVQWQSDLGENGNSDADGDGDSDAVDFLIWQRNFATTAGSTRTQNAIPEPGSLLLLLLGLCYYSFRFVWTHSRRLHETEMVT